MIKLDICSEAESSLLAMHRFFISPQWISGNNVVITGSLVHQFHNVLRFKVGDVITILDNSGWEYVVEIINMSSNQTIGKVLSRTAVVTEPRVRITLYQSLLKKNKFETVLEKCTEVGVSNFIPVISERCIVKGNRSKVSRWNTIITETAEQSHRGILPVLHPISTFEDVCRNIHGLSFLAWEEEQLLSIKQVLQNSNITSHNESNCINLFIGPEGGFSTSEVKFAQDHGVIICSLGKRILRAETASIVASSIIFYECGDFEL